MTLHRSVRDPSPLGARAVAILGSTGSIGEQALNVIRLHSGRLRVVALAAGSRVERLREQALEFLPELVSVSHPDAARALVDSLPPGIRVVCGEAGLTEIARCPSADVVLNALVGSVGLSPSLEALGAGKLLALANKETLVAGGELVARALLTGPGRLLAVDSEHWALGELLEGRNSSEARQVWITASGGPLRETDPRSWETLKPAAVLAHPIWDMGPRITVDSATMMNKGFEVLEARWMYGIPLERVGAIVHPEALVHAMVEWGDGSWTAHLSTPHMGLPIQRALLGERLTPTTVPPLNLLARGGLRFLPIDVERFPCYGLALEAAREGRTYAAALNAADEVAVLAFLEGRLSFPGIARVVREVLERHDAREICSAWDVHEADRQARELAGALVG